MDAKEELKDIADFVVDLLTDERGSKPQDAEAEPQSVDPNASLFQTDPALADALDRSGPDLDDDDDGPLSAGRGLRSLAQDDDPVTSVARAASAAPVAKAAAPQPVREVVHNVVRERIIREQPQVTRVTEQHTNNTFVREGDNIVDNRVTNSITAEGEDIKINLSQDIANKTVIADDGGIATGGNVQDAALNTGRVQGVLAGDDVDAEDAIIGDDNTAIEDSELGAFAKDGDATNFDGDGGDDDEGPRTGTGTRNGTDDGPRTRTGKLPEEEGPVNGKAPTADPDVLKEDVDLDFEDEQAPPDAPTADDEDGTEPTGTDAKERTEDEGPTTPAGGDAKTGEPSEADATGEGQAKAATTAEEQAETQAPGAGEDRAEGKTTTNGTEGDQPAPADTNGRDTNGRDTNGSDRNGSNGSDDDQRAGAFGAESDTTLDSPDPFDADGDGVLDDPDLVDANRDGVLDNPEQFDADGDGLIDRPDLLDLDNDGDADFLLRPAHSFGGDDDLDLDN